MNSRAAGLDPVVIPGSADAIAASLIAEAERVLSALDSVDASALSANGLLIHVAGIAGLGRLVEGAQVDAAAVIAIRSDRRLGSEGLASRHGCATAAQLVEKVTGVAARTARQLVRVATQSGARATDTGLPLEPLFPMTGAALRAGSIGIDVADVITTTLKNLPATVAPDALRWAERALVNQAVGHTADGDSGGSMPLSADLIREQANVFRDALDPDGIEPRAERLVELRALRFTPQPNGMLCISGQLPPEQAAIITPVFDAFLSPLTSPAFAPAGGDGFEKGSGGAGSADSGVVRDPRTRDQQRADILTALCEGATKLGKTPKLHGAMPTVMVTITADHLAFGTGTGASPSTPDPLPPSAVRQFACDGGTHAITLGRHGEILRLSAKDRFFTTAQRKAMIARDGRTCAHPACTIPAYWAEAHHVKPASEGGPTTIENGVLLCWFHHRLLDRGEWTITMNHGRPVFHPPTWLPRRRYLRPRQRT